MTTTKRKTVEDKEQPTRNPDIGISQIAQPEAPPKATRASKARSKAAKGRNAPPILSEHREQCLVVQWFKLAHPNVKIMAIPNGGHRSISVAKKLKAEGVSAGVPDLFVPAWRLWIEMKRSKGGSVSQDQKDWIDYLRANGYTVLIAKGFDAAVEGIRDHAPITARFDSAGTTP